VHQAEGGSPSVVIERLLPVPADLEAVDAIAQVSFSELGFSAEKELERPWARVWVARERPSASGGGAVSTAPLAFLVGWHVADEIHILNVATAPAARRRGLGTALMGVALEYAAQNRVRLLLLEVRASNADARRLYQKLGFVVTGVRAAYYADNGEDAIEMMLTLDPETGRVIPPELEFSIDV
jgi:ribosomal-protein-alanine N-acetyltransferase